MSFHDIAMPGIGLMESNYDELVSFSRLQHGLFPRSIFQHTARMELLDFSDLGSELILDLSSRQRKCVLNCTHMRSESL